MKEIQFFHDSLADIPSIAEPIKNRRHPIIGYLCSYVPEELIMAAGAHPMRLFPSDSEISLADNHLQTYCCSPVKGILEDCLAGRLDFLDGMVFPHTCDAVQRLSDIWRMNAKPAFFADLIWPSKLSTQSARDYTLSILRAFKDDLEAAFSIRITEDALLGAVQLTNSIRSDLYRLYTLKATNPGAISARDLYTMVKGSMVMDRQQVADQLPTIVGRLEQAEPCDKNKKRIIISGAMCDFPSIAQHIEEAGGYLVGDDFCTGQRWFEGLTSLDSDPIKAIAERYISRMACPAKHSSLTHRSDHIVDLAKSLKADGVIFSLTKFCDPHAFDYPHLKATLDSAGIKNTGIEIDTTALNSGQLSTRIETFIQML